MTDLSKLVVHAEDILSEKVYDGVRLNRYSKRINADHAVIQKLSLAPDAAVREHSHPDKEELQYVMTGSGEVVLGGEKTQVRKGSVVYIPIDVKHSIKNTGKEDMTVLEVYAK